MNAMTQAAAADDIELAAPKPPLMIDPNQVTQNYAGFAFSEYFIRLPIEAIADDLNSNRDMWKSVQRSKGLKKFDRLTIIAYDESWVAEALVAEAGAASVTLTKPRILTLPVRQEKLLNDGTYKLVWSGAGYDVIRIADNAKMNGPHANTVLAERALAQMYPRRA